MSPMSAPNGALRNGSGLPNIAGMKFSVCPFLTSCGQLESTSRQTFQPVSNIVILIDDNAWEHVAAKLKAMFALSGFELEVFSSADAYFMAFPDTNPRCAADLFIIDVMMPPGERYKSQETHDGFNWLISRERHTGPISACSSHLVVWYKSQNNSSLGGSPAKEIDQMHFRKEATSIGKACGTR